MSFAATTMHYRDLLKFKMAVLLILNEIMLTCHVRNRSRKHQDRQFYITSFLANVGTTKARFYLVGLGYSLVNEREKAADIQS